MTLHLVLFLKVEGQHHTPIWCWKVTC